MSLNRDCATVIPVSEVAIMALAETRFGFGENWRNFLNTVDEARLAASKEELNELVGGLEGKSFLDVGSGSGIHSRSAVELGATRVHSFDYDPASVECTRIMRAQIARDCSWVVEQGSVLDESYLRALGQFDVVYSWGVLHHTGAMWHAMKLIQIPVAQGGMLAIAIYNDQGFRSKVWRAIKKIYNRLPPSLRPLYVVLVWAPREVLYAAYKVFTKGPRAYRRIGRGMSRWHDIVDWVGGYPCEVARPEEIVDFYAKCGFELVKVKTCGRSLGNNQFLFRRSR